MSFVAVILELVTIDCDCDLSGESILGINFGEFNETQSGIPTSSRFVCCDPRINYGNVFAQQYINLFANCNASINNVCHLFSCHSETESAGSQSIFRVYFDRMKQKICPHELFDRSQFRNFIFVLVLIFGVNVLSYLL